MGVLVFVVRDVDLRKEGVSNAADQIAQRSSLLPKPTGPDDPSLDVYIYIPGKTWQHEKSGYKLGSLSEKSRAWQRVMIYVPDELTDEDEAIQYFDRTLADVADAVEAKLRKRQPLWPIDQLVGYLRSLRSAHPAT
ncbi:MAG: hypothetical protein RJQ01_05495 [Microcella sp.]|uniref:hypothetical protein n=1 Tax=Microcella sp. TaxID=1913979 RepID=UPI0033148FF2